jgi:phage replication O-like protein O
VQDATPQLEDGYTRIANELFDAILAYPFSARQLKVLMTIVRKTYGYNKKRDDISASQIGAACGLARPHVAAVLGELADMNVIFKQSGRFGTVVEINKRYGSWTSTKSVQGSTEMVQGCTESVLVPNRYTPCTDSVQVASTKSVHTKDNLPKDNQQKTRVIADPEFDEAWGLYPKRDGGNSKTDALKAWNARVGSGVAPADLLAGVKRYAAYCKAKEMIGTRYVKQAATFFGPGAHYAEAWGQSIESGDEWWKAAGFEKDWQATNAGCTPRTAYLWRDGKRIEVEA